MTAITQPVLLVDDDESVLASLRLLLKQAGIATAAAVSAEETMAWLSQNIASAVIQDMNFSRSTSGEEGLALLDQIQEQHPGLPVILLTAWGSIDLAVAGMKRGASDFLTKPWDNDYLIQVVRTAISLAAQREQAQLKRGQLDQQYDFSGVVGQHPRMLDILNTVARVANTDASVLILGESGTGKEVVAKALHRNSARRNQALVSVNLGGVPTTLFESEMFGHVRGAFTDANRDRQGRFAQADGGTIFLDEIGELDKSSQVKLLRVLQDRVYQPVGSNTNALANVRVVAATNRDLSAEVEAGRFREDLLYRINLITITLPPLRERPSDIALLAQSYLDVLADKYQRRCLKLSAAALAWLQQQPWPGNVRQLHQALERVVLMSNETELSLETLQRDLGTLREVESVSEPSNDHELTLEAMERQMIESALRQHNGNVSHAARQLGLSRAALYRRMEKYAL